MSGGHKSMRDLHRTLRSILHAVEERNRADKEFQKSLVAWLDSVKEPSAVGQTRADSSIRSKSPEVVNPSSGSASQSSDVEAVDTRDETERKSKSRREDAVGSRAAPALCAGCEDFQCAMSWKVMEHVPLETAEQWFIDHHIIKEPTCDKHPGSRLRRDGQAYVCTERIGGNACRKRFHVCQPILTTRNYLTAKHLLHFWCLVANGEKVMRRSFV